MDALQRLYQAASAFEGCTLETLATQRGLKIPEDARYAKGWIGQCIEHCLGVTDPHHAGPDFASLQVELKTIPVNEQGHPYESTFVCAAPMAPPFESTWETSSVWNKLQRVLWMPILGNPKDAWGKRAIGRAVVWTPSETQIVMLKRDWEELTSFLREGRVGEVSAHYGEVMQLRPKAANAQSRTWGLNEYGERVRILPLGFYLRASFTATLLQPSR